MPLRFRRRIGSSRSVYGRRARPLWRSAAQAPGHPGSRSFMSEVNNHLFETIDRQNARRVRAHAAHAREGHGDGNLGREPDRGRRDRRGARHDRQHGRPGEAGRQARRRHQAQHPGRRPAGEEPLRAADVQRRRRQAGHEDDLRARRGVLSRGAADDARRRRPGVHQRLPARHDGVRPAGQPQGLAVRPVQRRDHGDRGGPPRGRAAVARQARATIASMPSSASAKRSRDSRRPVSPASSRSWTP